jgi:hypothetical protein
MFASRISLGEVEEVVRGEKWLINRDAIPVKEVRIVGLTWCSWCSRDLEGRKGKQTVIISSRLNVISCH